MEKSNRGGARQGAGRPKKPENYAKQYRTDLKTHASISKIIEMRKLNKITAESLDICLEEALKSKE